MVSSKGSLGKEGPAFKLTHMLVGRMQFPGATGRVALTFLPVASLDLQLAACFIKVESLFSYF